MAAITIRNLNEETKNKLRQRAARHGHSMEEEARRILDQAVNQEVRTGLGSWIHGQFAAIGGVELALPARSAARPALQFEEDGA